MRLVFVTPVRSEQVASDWERICRLVKRTVTSALAQTGDIEIHCILVCHEAPLDPADFDGRVSIVHADYPAPTREELKTGDHGDKWTKIHLGLVAARELDPTHLMLLDEDDLVSNRIGQHITNHPDVDGWEFSDGYVYQEGGKTLLRKPEFDKACGSSFVFRIAEGTLPTSRADQRENFPILRWGHGLYGEKLRQAGLNVQPIPFPAAIYMVGTGENCTNHRLSSFASIRDLATRPWRLRPLTEGLRSEFGLTPLD